jgi:hypothetical protein
VNNTATNGFGHGYFFCEVVGENCDAVEIHVASAMELRIRHTGSILVTCLWRNNKTENKLPITY